MKFLVLLLLITFSAKAESRDNKVRESIELQIKHHIRQKVVIAQRQSRCEKYTKDLKNLQLKMAKANLLDAGLQVDIQGAFFNCSHPKISKCQPVSKLRPKKLEYQNCSHPKKNKERKKLEYPNCSHPFNISKYRQVHIFQVTDHACEGTG